MGFEDCNNDALMSKDLAVIIKKSQIKPKTNMEPSNSVEKVPSSIHINYPRGSSERSKSNSSATSSEKKRRAEDLLDDLMPKRQRHYKDSYMRKLIDDAVGIPKQERSGSTGKRSRGSFNSEAGPEGEEAFIGSDSVSKRKKVGHCRHDMHLKMISPLQLPEYAMGYDYELYPEIIKLNMQLMKINKKLRGGGAIIDCLENKQSSSSISMHNEKGIRISTKENRFWKKLHDRKQKIICEINRKNPLLLPPSDNKPTKFFRKLYIPVKQYPNYNFVGLIIGPRGHTQKRMERESGARILLRGKGSTRQNKGKQCKDPKNDDEDLHVYIEAEDEKSLESASEMVEKLLVPVNEEMNKLKHDQLRELAELNSTTPNNLLCNAKDDERTMRPLYLLDPTNSHQPALVSFLHDKINTESHNAKTKLFVGFLPITVSSERLGELFSPFGTLCEAIVIMNQRTGLSKGYGFVKYNDPCSAAEAFTQMNGCRIDGKLIVVRLAGRVPLSANTIIGPRAFRFCACPYAFSPGINKGCNSWTHYLGEPHACFPKCNASSLSVDSMYRFPHTFTDFLEQCPVMPPLFFGGHASSVEFVPFS